MGFSFNNIFKRNRGEDTSQSTLDLEKDFNNLKENIVYGQKMLGIGSWTCFLKEDEMFFSDEMYNIFEFIEEESKDNFQNLDKYIHPDDKVEILKSMEGLLKGKDYDLNYRIITKDGSVKFLHEKTKTFCDENNNVIKIIGVLEDITNIKLMENDLKSINENCDFNKSIEGFGNWQYNSIKKEYSWSEEVYKIHDINPVEFKRDYKNVIKLIHIDDRLEIKENIKKALDGKPFKAEYRALQKDGSIKHVITYVEPQFNKEGKVIALLGSIKDITKRKALKRTIEEKEDEIYKVETRFEKIIKESKDGFEIVDIDGKISYSSGSSEKIIGYNSEEIIDAYIYDFFEGKDLKIIKTMLYQALKTPGKGIESDVNFNTKQGKEIYLEVYMANLLYEPSISGILVNFRDVSEKIEIQKKMLYDANHDKLTELQTRDYFLEKLKLVKKEAKIQNTKHALLMIEVDGFKHINFSLGHGVGDKLILKVVERLKTIFKDSRYISRYSDDHFAVIASGGKYYSDYESVAQETIELFSKPFKIDSYELILTINIGLCIFPKENPDSLPLKNSAKIALIRAQSKGKNTYKFYSSGLNINYFKEFTLRSDLSSAIEKEELELYYQPVINLKTNEIVGAEALIRWNHPEWGVVPPGEFISIAEETELIIDVGNWVLKEVCKNYKKWQNDKLPNIKIGVNFSAIQFFEIDFVKNIKDIIDQFKLEADFLTVEITESVLLKNKEKVLDDIKSLQDIGIEIALDDFGTGFSSLSYLSYLNIDILKIDKSFIKKIPLDRTNSAITRATIKLAKELNIKVIAEGIENWNQLSYLQSLNCAIGQGHIYSEAKPVEEFEKILSKKKCKPMISNNFYKGDKDRRKFFRINFLNLLESELTIMKIGVKTINIGNTKVLVKNIGPGGLCFISNVRFPVEKDIILKFTTNLIEEELILYGNPVWEEQIDGGDEVDGKIYEHGIEFTIYENDRELLVKTLNDVEIKMRNNILFAEGSFISGDYKKYFK